MSNNFKYPDTNSSRGKIEFLNRKFEGQKIAIIGLGGTGSYILDLVAKTDVSEIHLFDYDIFQLHNAFRSPGAPDGELLDKGIKKVDYFHEIYSRMHNYIVPHDTKITSDNLHVLSGFSFVFISVDKNEARHTIAHGLVGMAIPFADTGLGLKMVNDALIGTIRVTTASKEKNDHLVSRFGSDEFEENEYSTNVQIAELNCYAAVLAVLKWKKLLGFYQDFKSEYNTLYFINTNKLLNEDHSA